MTVIDPIADMLTRIRNAVMAGHALVAMPSSKLKLEIAKFEKLSAMSSPLQLVGGDRKDWAFVVVVEDTVQVAPEVKDQEFLAEVRRHEAEEVSKARAARASKLVADAEWKEAAAGPPPAD